MHNDMSVHICIQKWCSKTLGKHVFIYRNATLEWLFVTACVEFIDLYGLQMCLSSVLWSASACLHLQTIFVFDF